MAKVTVINSAPFSAPDYTEGDERAILPLTVSPSFTTANGRVEAFIYDLQGNLLNYNPNARYSIIENGGGSDPNVASRLELYPQEEVESLSIDVGTYNVSYNILNNELGSSFSTPFALKQISANRKELRLTTSFLTEDELQEEVSKIAPSEITSPYYPDYVVNLGNNRISIVTNILFDNSNNQHSVLVKLYEALPSYASERDAIWIASKQRDSIAYQVELEAPTPLPTPRKNVLKGPNFSLPLNNQVHSSVKLTSLEELQNISGITTASRRQLGSILNEKGISVNIDYTNFENYIHFSSAQERIRNFHYKVGLIESCSNRLSAEPAAGGNAFLSESRAALENKISNIIDNFDGFEYWMYYTSASQTFSSDDSDEIYSSQKKATSRSGTNFSAGTGVLEGGSGTIQTISASANIKLSGFNFGVPNNATITGVQVRYRYDTNANQNVQMQTSLEGTSGITFTAAGVIGEDQINGDSGPSEVEAIVGGNGGFPGGASGITPANVNTLSLVISASGDDGNGTEIATSNNRPSITVFYQVPALQFPTPYPKTNSSKPFTLASTSSNEAQAWLTEGLSQGELYDNDNSDNLINTIPEYLREDPDNAPFEKFIEMIGQHFDTLYTYAQDITNRYNGDNRLDFGISKDLVGDAIQSMGLNLYTGNFTSVDLVDSLVGTRTPSILPDGQEVALTVNDYVTASADVVPVEDVNKEIYKRIYHNLPLLVRQKGSLAGVRTLITCFGIPEEILKIREFDIQGKSTIYDLPAVGASTQIAFTSESAVFPPERTDWIPPKFLSPAIRVQQDYVNSESYDRSLQYVEVGFSPQTNIDEVEHSGFNPFVDFPDFNDFYNGGDMNYYASKFITGPQASGQTATWNWSAFVRYIKFFDSSLFNMIKDFSPLRSSTATGVIIKPTIKERQRQRPAQISGQDIASTNITASSQTEGYNWTDEEFYIRPIGNYFLRNGARGLEATANKDGAYVPPGSTGGTFNDYNRVGFAKSPETDWGRNDIKSPIRGFTQNWSETMFNVLNYASSAQNYPSSSLVKTFVIDHNNQDEFYNGIFQQRPNGIGNFNGYLTRELKPTGSIGSIKNGSGLIRTDNNINNPYKVPISNEFAGLTVGAVDSITDFLNASSDIIYQVAASTILIKVGASSNLTQELLLQNGSTLTFKVGNTIVAYNVGSPTTVNNLAGTYVGFFAIDNPTINDNVFVGASAATFIANIDPTAIPGLTLDPWGSSEFNPLIGNSFDPNAGLVNYAGIRKSEIYQDVDYSPSASSSINPINITLLASGSASRAAVQDSNYSSRWWLGSRYDGIRNTSIDFNVPILKAVEDINVIYTSESIGIDPFISQSSPNLPELPRDTPR